MAKKTITSFNVEQAMGRIVRPSVFDQILKEVDAQEIPAKYVQQILVHYHDGSTVELSGKDLEHPLPVNRSGSREEIAEHFKKMKDIKILIDTNILEQDVNAEVEKYLGRFC
jgi:hypothetical protein